MIFTFFILAWSLLAPALAVPAPRQDAGWWLSSIERRGKAAFNSNADYKVFRNVKDYGAKGDGSTDDTDAINKAIADGNRCTQGCSSSTTTPALVYFPPGTYAVSKPIIMLYYTQMVGDVINLPTIKALPEFDGMAVIDADPYDNEGNNFWVNQNNFFRQIRNFAIDLTAMPVDRGAGIHWQVAQATSLQNIVFNMREDGGDQNRQQGIFMDNGSGGFMSDLTFNGGRYGAFFGNQQFTTRNMTFNNCKTAIFMNWNWAWTFHDIKINNCEVGIDMSNGGPTSQTVGSVLVVDSSFTNTPIGIRTAYDPNSPQTNGTLVLDNVDMSGTSQAVVNNATGEVIVPPGKVNFFVQGRTYEASNLAAGKAVQTTQNGIQKPQVLVDANTGKVFTRSKPQYENVPASSFVSVKANGAKGDGVTDDTAAIQKIFDSVQDGQIVYFDHGAYIITDTVKVPKNIKITGEILPLILAGGDKAFTDQTKPKPVFQVGEPGDKGSVEMTDLIFGTAGPQPGAIIMEWNLAGDKPGAAALWDVHTRIGGYAGTELQLEKCAKNPNATNVVSKDCFGAGMMLHVRNGGSVYLENTWYWVADHDLEPEANNAQIDVFNGRGVLIEGEGPVWGWATASEHSVLYNYQFNNASNVYLALIQTETPYFQGNPAATSPYEVLSEYNDPNFAKTCDGQNDDAACARAWGVRAINSKDIFIYGAGLYSFFDNYNQDCLKTQSCQKNMVSLEDSAVHFFGLSTKASVNMLTVNGKSAALDQDNRNNFCATLALFHGV